MITKHVEAIETRLGVRLLHRSTRRLTLTEAGRSYLDACQRILAEIEEAEQEAAAGQTEPRGLLRVNMPVSFGTLQIAPLLGRFVARHPLVELDLGLNDRVVDLIEEGWDLAIRIGMLRDSSLVARRLAPCQTVVCASPPTWLRTGRRGASPTWPGITASGIPCRSAWASGAGASEQTRRSQPRCRDDCAPTTATRSVRLRSRASA